MHTPTTKTIGANVRAELGRRGMSQAALASHLGISQSQLSKRLLGRIEFGVGEVYTIADFLNVPAKTLMPDEAVPTDA